MKAQLRIPFHSFVDVITNSSTEMYVKVSEKCIDATKEIIEKVLEASGCGKKFDDLFTIRIEGPEVDMDEFFDTIEDKTQARVEQIMEENDDITRNQARKKAEAEFKCKSPTSNWGDVEVLGDDSIIIEAKDGKMETINLIGDIPFEAVECAC